MLSRQKKRAKPVKSYAENIDDDDYTDRVKDPMNEEVSQSQRLINLCLFSLAMIL